ncbi:MAG: amidophosphoribosyltransferase [Bacteroidetes bacterium]|nr:amidophosphoribosyltransferase [Bacteroidota bacterium]
MSDAIKHECGIALLRLLKPLDYYKQKYGSEYYGLKKLYLLLEKQHNRGQDGAGIVTIRLNPEPGERYISRKRSNQSNPIADIFKQIDTKTKEPGSNAYMGEVLMGHLRYGTFGGNSIENCHPFLRTNNWMSRNLAICGNFNFTNVDELFQQLVDLGQHPKEKSDNVTLLEKIGHFLDEENQRVFELGKKEGLENNEISKKIQDELNLENVLKPTFKKVDGGYAICGAIGHGDAFVMRDPSGIRPAFYYCDDEIVVVTSERPAIQTAFDVPLEQIKEITPGCALVVKRDGSISEVKILEPLEKKSCSFERIYFSRGNDKDIYIERKKLGYYLAPAVLKEINYDIKNTVFSYIPNTADKAFYGLIDGVHNYLNNWKIYEVERIIKENGSITSQELEEIMWLRPRREKIAIKDGKLRTFITQDSERDDMVAHIYDVTYGVVRRGIDNLVMIDDSIVRGTTLKQSILRILDRLGPKKVVVLSSAPHIRYPDCYGIDMSKMGDFVAFQALIALLYDDHKEHLIKQTYELCKVELEKAIPLMRNCVKDLYDIYSEEQLSKKITEILTPEDMKAEVSIIYQNIPNLHKACPDNLGDWYFSGNYPTPGGNKVVNRAFINYVEKNNQRAY